MKTAQKINPQLWLVLTKEQVIRMVLSSLAVMVVVLFSQASLSW